MVTRKTVRGGWGVKGPRKPVEERKHHLNITVSYNQLLYINEKSNRSKYVRDLIQKDIDANKT